MSQFSDYLEDALLKHIFRNTDFARPAILYVALYTAAPSDAGGGTEVSSVGTDYARQGVATGAASGWDAPSVEGGGGYQTANTGAITFPVAAIDWGIIVAAGLFDALSGGNLLFWGNLSANKTVNAGDVFKFTASSFKIYLR